MIAALLISITLTASPEVSTEEMAEYRSARAEAGHDAEAHLKLALWCEQHGLSAQRMEHLALALMADPANATARGLMGLMKDGKSWSKPEKVAERIASDAEQAQALGEYNAQRSKADMTADDQWKLALWCEDHGLVPEAKAHLAAVVRLDPSREAAWKRLGCRKHHGRWMTPEQIDAAIVEEKAQEKADKLWGPKLARLKDDLKVASKRADAEREIAKIDAPRAVPTAWRMFAQGSAEDQELALQVFAQTDAVGASQALAMLVIFGKSDVVRRAATESLVWRDQREYLDILIVKLRKPMKYEVRPVPDGRGTVELFVEGEQYNVARDYSLPNPPNTAWLTNPPASFLPGGGTMMAEQYAKAAMERQRQDTGQLPLAQQMALASTLTQNLNNPAPAVAALAQTVATPSQRYYPNVSSSIRVPMDSFISTGHALPPPTNFSYDTPDHMWVATSGQMTPSTFISEVSAARQYQQRLAQAAFLWQEFRRSVVAREAQVERDVAA
ncbi:MAG TPA: hypothetical protein VFT74_17785, partial [Isosphaeraceae bacterium]|nr:hypothetical protein [Isosphaeraceae bacterium]